MKTLILLLFLLFALSTVASASIISDVDQSNGQGNDKDRSICTIGTIPEPATVALLGLGALALIRRKRRW